MNKMKALLWREYMLGRKKILFSLIAFAMTTVLGWLALISIKHGNLETALKNVDGEFPGMTKVLDELLYYAAMYVPAFMSIMMTDENGAVSSDLKSGWKLFGRTLPVTAAESLGAKYILKVISIAAVFLVNMGNFAVVSLLADKEITAFHVNALLLPINISLLSGLVKDAVLYRAKTEKETFFAEIASIAVFVILCIPYFRRLNRNVSGIAANDNLQSLFKMMGVMADDMKRIFPFMLPAMLVLMAGGYFLHLMIVRRAEK